MKRNKQILDYEKVQAYLAMHPNVSVKAAVAACNIAPTNYYKGRKRAAKLPKKPRAPAPVREEPQQMTMIVGTPDQIRELMYKGVF